MGMVFDTSEGDVLAVLADAGQRMSDSKVSQALAALDIDLVEAAARHFDDLDEQTSSAHAEIRRQMIDLGYLPATAV